MNQSGIVDVVDVADAHEENVRQRARIALEPTLRANLLDQVADNEDDILLVELEHAHEALVHAVDGLQLSIIAHHAEHVAVMRGEHGRLASQCPATVV